MIHALAHTQKPNQTFNAFRVGLVLSKIRCYRPLLKLLTLIGLLYCAPAISSDNNTTPNSDSAKPVELPICAYVASYRPGYEWQDEITKAVNKTLNGHCHVKTFYMNSKALKSRNQLMETGQLAADFIKSSSAKVVIVSDDNAVRYVLQEHFKDAELPFVFCGVNDSGKRYRLPYKNTTGMIEKNPLEEMLKLVFATHPAKTNTAFLSTQSNSANINANEFIHLASSLGIEFSVYQVSNLKQWQEAYLEIQHSPYIDLFIFSNREPIKDWDEQANLKLIEENNHKLSLTMHPFMMPYTAIGMTKMAAEQGEWAALAAIEILKGAKPSQLAIVPNEKFQLWVNPKLIKPFRSDKLDSFISQALIYNLTETQ